MGYRSDILWIRHKGSNARFLNVTTALLFSLFGCTDLDVHFSHWIHKLKSVYNSFFSSEHRSNSFIARNNLSLTVGSGLTVKRAFVGSGVPKLLPNLLPILLRGKDDAQRSEPKNWLRYSVVYMASESKFPFYHIEQCSRICIRHHFFSVEISIEVLSISFNNPSVEKFGVRYSWMTLQFPIKSIPVYSFLSVTCRHSWSPKVFFTAL